MAHQSWPNTMVASAKNLSIISTIQATPLYRNEEFLRQMFLEKQLSTRQIAREICSARSTVKEALCGFGIPLRPEEAARQLNKGQLAFGERMINGKAVRHAAEQRVLARMVELRRSGASYGKITDWLNTKGVPTKNRASKWDRPTVYKVLRNCSRP